MGPSNLSVINTMTTAEVNLENQLEKVKSKGNIYLITKRMIDVILSSIAIIGLFPLFLVIGILIKIDSRGSIFFAHKRIGKNGKEIRIYKFRTMLVNAEEMIQKFTPEQLREYKENYKLQNDPRITKIGDFLRKTSLDELPQIFNILKGELSIVGPRPVVEEELEKYGANREKLLSVIPGLTGFWQANGRSTTTYEERMKMELYYVDHSSLWLDIKIFFKTIVSVLKKEGAV